jgi:acetyl-CoA carboxylase biotin carboxyl carrier protein
MPGVPIKSPLPGVFYRRPGVGEPPFVSEGGRVEAGDVVGLVEVMKMFNEVRAEAAGVLERFLVEDEEAVEAGQDIAVLGDGSGGAPG